MPGDFGESGWGEESGVGSVVAALELSAEDFSRIDDEEADVSGIVKDGIHSEQTGQLHIEVGLFFDLPDGAFFDALVNLDKTCR